MVIVVDCSVVGTVYAYKSFRCVSRYATQPACHNVSRTLSGDEAGIYHRDKVTLVDGRATILLPEHFVVLAHPDTISVDLTPVSLDSKGVGVASIEKSKIEIGELAGGTGAYDVFYCVYATRSSEIGHRAVQSDEELKRNMGDRNVGSNKRRRSIPPAAKRETRP